MGVRRTRVLVKLGWWPEAQLGSRTVLLGLVSKFYPPPFFRQMTIFTVYLCWQCKIWEEFEFWTPNIKFIRAEIYVLQIQTYKHKGLFIQMITYVFRLLSKNESTPALKMVRQPYHEILPQWDVAACKRWVRLFSKPVPSEVYLIIWRQWHLSNWPGSWKSASGILERMRDLLIY